MAGLCAPLSTLRRCPRGHLRMTRGRCGSLLLHRDGLAPSTPCRSPGALRVLPATDFATSMKPRGPQSSWEHDVQEVEARLGNGARRYLFSNPGLQKLNLVS